MVVFIYLFGFSLDSFIFYFVNNLFLSFLFYVFCNHVYIYLWIHSFKFFSLFILLHCMRLFSKCFFFKSKTTILLFYYFYIYILYFIPLLWLLINVHNLLYLFMLGFFFISNREHLFNSLLIFNIVHAYISYAYRNVHIRYTKLRGEKKLLE